MFSPSKKPPRLGQWDGRRHSSRADEPVLSRLWHRPLVLRLAVVWLTTVAVTALVYAGGPPLPYRLGEICPHDLRVRVGFQVINYVALANQAQTQRAQGAGQRAT